MNNTFTSIFHEAVIPLNEEDEYVLYLKGQTISEKLWKSTYRKYFIDSYYKLLNILKTNYDGKEGISYPGHDDDWKEEEIKKEMIPHMDSFRGGPNDSANHCMMKSLALADIYLGEISILKRKSFIKELNSKLDEEMKHIVGNIPENNEPGSCTPMIKLHGSNRLVLTFATIRHDNIESKFQKQLKNN